MNLFLRAMTAIALLPIVVGAVYFGEYTVVVAFVVGFLLADEIVSMCLGKGHMLRPIFWPACAMLMILLFAPSFGSPAPIFGVWLFIAFFGIVLVFSPGLKLADISRVALSMGLIIYVFSSLACLVYLRKGVAGDDAIGRAFVILALLSTFSNDTFAYLVGRMFGKHPLLKSVSQNKTWEGFFGGALASILVPFVFMWVFDRFDINIFAGLEYRDLLFVALGIAVIAPIGDLFESRIKRALDVKDSGSILPGHGGLFDRVDALLMALPFTFAYAFFLRTL